MTPLALYLHWPFCRSKCPYCDFNSHVVETVDHTRWKNVLLRELRYEAARHAGRLVSIFFGGGTPSLMEPATVAALVEEAKRQWGDHKVEVTLEANPTSVEAARLKDFKAAGINRLSMGMQAMNDADLRFLGREHSAVEARRAFERASSLFDRASFDLIYARPGQTPAAWKKELHEALAFQPTHLSLYQLTIEPETPFARWHKAKKFTLPQEEAAAEMFEVTQEVMDAAGLPAYEISNHAAKGQECRHNLAYWRSEDCIGIGPGAHGRVWQGQARRATVRLRAPERWLQAVERDGHGTEKEEMVSASEAAEEIWMMGLRLTEGVPLVRVRPLPGWDEARLAALTEEGLLSTTPTHVAATRSGRLVLNHVLERLLT